MVSKSPMDIRIIVEGASDVEGISKAMKGLPIGSDYHVTISSIIPTTNLEIAENAVKGADVVLIATDVDAPGRELAEKYQNALKGKVGHVERMKFPYGHDVEYINPKIIQEEIKNAIIRAGLSSLSNIKELNETKQDLENIQKEYDDTNLENQNLALENKDNLKKIQDYEERINVLQDRISDLNNDLDTIKIEYSNLKTHFNSLHDKEIFEIFSLADVYLEIFNEEISNEDKIVYLTNQFKPNGIIIGQGLIAAESKQDAIDWLKVIKTSLILLEKNSEKELKLNLNQFKDETDSSTDSTEDNVVFPNFF